MNVKYENICRLCLNVVDKEFQVVDDITKGTLDILMLRMNLNISKDPIICKDCVEVCVKWFAFKSACSDIEKLISSFAVGKNKAMFELKDIFEDRKDVRTIDADFMCRFCTNRVWGSDVILLDTLMKDDTFAETLPVIMPEVDLGIINNPVICTTCKQYLENYIKFVENCLDIEKKIVKYCQNEGIPNNAKVNLSDILYFFGLNNYTRTIKQENTSEEEAHYEVYHSELIKVEGGIDIKAGAFNLIETASSDIPVYKCLTSTFKTEDRRFLVKAEDILDIKVESINCNETACDTLTYPKCKCNTCFIDTENSMHITEVGEGLNIKDEISFDCKTPSDLPVCNTLTCDKNVTNYDYQVKHETRVKAFQTKEKNNVNKNHVPSTKKVQMYECKMCSYETKYKGSLNRHMLVHKAVTEVDIYKCVMCTFQTKHKGSIQSHMLTHKDIKEAEMYKCAMCTFQTKQKRSIRRHMLIHKDISKVEIYRCTKCTYKTKYERNLKFHLLIHKDITEVEMHKCPSCSFQAKHKSNLKSHMLIHKVITDVEMYKCSVCTFKTKQKRYLKNHMLRHKDVTEVEMYKCAMCNFQTKHRRSIRSHLKTHK